jgi:hemoglobin/transferrin/lactoferrin receptor protein
MHVSAVQCIILLVFSFVFNQTQAQIPADSAFLHSLTELVVTAQRSPVSGLGTAAAIEVLEKKNIRAQQFRTTPEALLAVPGVFVQKTNHGGGSPFLRGLTGNQTLLLIDGIRLSNATFRYGPNQYFNTIDIFTIEKIEVLRGSGSVQYGSDAIGGTIQVFTREATFSEKNDWGSEILSRGATQDMEQSYRAGVQFGSRRFALNGGFTFRDFGHLIGGDTTGKQSPSAYQEMDVDLKVKAALSPATTLSIAHQNVRQNQVPVFHKIQLEDFAVNEFDPQQRILTYARLEQTLNRGIWKSLSFTASWHNTEEGRRSRKNGASVLRYENDKVRSFALIGQLNNVFNKRWSANSGLEVYSDYVNSTRTDTDENTGISSEKRGLYPNDALMTSFAAFSLHTFDLPKWNFIAGARWNAFVIQVTDEAIGNTKLQPSALVGNGAVMRKIGKGSNLFASLNSAFRAPNIDDLGTLGIVDFRFETPNYNLQPEHSLNFQIGYKLLKNKLKGEVYVYQNTLRNLISRIKLDTQMLQGYPLYQKENAERAYVQGIETAWSFAIARHWSVQSSITYAYGHNITKQEPMRRIPPLFGRLVLNYAPGAMSFGAELLAADKQGRLAKADTDDNRIPVGGTPGWAVLNFYAGYSWRFLSVRLSALNLFNEDYRTHGSGVNGYGRSVFATVAAQF